MSRTKRQDGDVGEADRPVDANHIAPQAEMSPLTRVRSSKVRQLAATDIQPSGHKWDSWSVVAQADHTIDDALHPRYLYAKANEIKPLDYIEIKHPFGHWVVCLDVIKVDRVALGLVAHIRQVVDYTKAETMVRPDLSGARIDFLGAERQWCVIDGHHVAIDGFQTRTAAEAWLAEQKRM